MRRNACTLAWLLHPLPVQRFIDGFWEKEPCHVPRNDHSYYDHIFDVAAFENTLEFSRLTPADLKVTAQGQTPPTRHYVYPDGGVNLDALRGFLADGFTIVVNGIERFSPPAAHFVQSLQRRLTFRVAANAYLTPGDSQGFRPHFDGHDVFILQVHGTKRWRLYHEAESLPLLGTNHETPFARENLPVPTIMRLAAGDVLYVPRGFVHEAETGDESSLHLTVGIHPPQWYDFMARVLRELALKHRRLRRALPPGYLSDPEVGSVLEQEFEELAQLLSREGSAVGAYNAFLDEFTRMVRNVPNGELVSSVDRLRTADLETRVAKQPYQFCRIMLGEDSAAIQYSSFTYTAPPQCADALVFVAENRGPFAASELPGLDDDEKIALVKELVRGGLLRFTDAKS